MYTAAAHRNSPSFCRAIFGPLGEGHLFFGGYDDKGCLHSNGSLVSGFAIFPINPEVYRGIASRLVHTAKSIWVLELSLQVAHVSALAEDPAGNLAPLPY